MTVAWALIAGCTAGSGQLESAARPQVAAPATAAPTPEESGPASPGLETATAPLPPPRVESLPTSLPTAAPTASPRPLLTLAVPPAWLPRAREAVVGWADAAWQWRVSDDASATADVILAPTGEGVPVWQQPLALAVPFTTEWDGATLAEAQQILDGGHPLVTVVGWADLTPQQRALRVDGLRPADPGYPLQERWSLAAPAALLPAARALALRLQEQIAPDPVVHLGAVGDVMLDRSLGFFLARGELAYPFQYVAPWLQAPDLTIGNLESALGDGGEPAGKRYTFRAPPAAATALALAGFDVVSLANNHGQDYGAATLLQGIGLLQEAGLAPVGAGANAAAAYAPHVVTVRGLRLAFLGYVNVPVEAVGNFDTRSWAAGAAAPGLAWGEPDRIRADVAAVAPQVDHVIVILHSGYEYVEAPSPPQVDAAHAAVEAGASLVIGHHAHILQGIEFYRQGIIVYGLGNFAFEITGPPETAMLDVWLDQAGVRQLGLTPAIVGPGGVPRPAEPWEAAPILARVYWLTTLLSGE